MELREQLQSTLGDAYTIEHELAGGGMSRVFVAHEATLDRKVVVKTLSPEYAGAVSAARFRREIRLAASLQQANIVPVHAVGETNGLPYYTMPFVEGRSLRSHLTERRTIPISEAIGILRDIARALAFAHERGVVHRDIKPENVLMSGSTAVVTDFGIAKALEASRTSPDSPTLTDLGATLGTPTYMSPEQASGDPAIDHRADIYALGIVAYELLTGAPPFIKASTQAMLVAHVMEQPVDVRERRIDLSAELAALVMACLAKSPADRPQSALEILRTLEPGSMHALAAVAAPGPSGMMPKPTIAVLPFTNMSASTDDEYFADGMTEDIIAQLSQIGSLQVISRTSAMRYKKSDLGTKDISRKLGASHIVEGSVRRAAARLRIVAQLIEAATDANLWAQTFDRDMTDVFAVQSEVAERVADALKAKLSPEQRRLVAKRPTDDQDAYELYLLARHHRNVATAESFARAIELYNQAIAKDPKFARAWGELAITHTWELAGYFGARPRDAAAKILPFATRALEIDSDVADAHLTMGMIAHFINHDWIATGQRLERALNLNPNSALAHLCYGNYLMTTGRWTDALDAGQQALGLDPAAEIVREWVCFFYYQNRQYDKAMAGYEISRAQFGRVPLQQRGITLLALGRPTEAVESFREAYTASPEPSWNPSLLAWGLAAAGMIEESRTLLAEIHARERTEYIFPVGVSLAYDCLGERDTAFRYLDQCYEERVAWVALPHLPCFDAFRGDPRFEAMLKKIGARTPPGA